MSNICLSEGVPCETIERYAEDMNEEDNMTSKLKFVNRLAVELAKARDTILKKPNQALISSTFAW